MAGQKIDKLNELKTLIRGVGFTVFAEDTDINSGKEPFIAIPVSKAELVGDKAAAYTIKLSALNKLINTSNIYNVSEHPEELGQKRGLAKKPCYVIRVPGHAVNSSLGSFSANFALNYEKWLVNEKNFTNLIKLEEILNSLDLKATIPQYADGPRKKATIPQYADGPRKMEVQVQAPAEVLSAINLTFKHLKLNFESDPNNPTIFKPVPVKADAIRMLAPIVGEFVTKYQESVRQTSAVKKSLLSYRTWVEKRIDWFQDNPKATFALSILGLLFLLAPGIAIMAAYFAGTNSTKPVDNFIIALGKGEQAAEEACKTFAHKNAMLVSACEGMQKIYHPEALTTNIDVNAIRQTKRILASLNPSQPVVQTVTPQQPNPAPYSDPLSKTSPQTQQPNTPTPTESTKPTPPTPGSTPTPGTS